MEAPLSNIVGIKPLIAAIVARDAAAFDSQRRPFSRAVYTTKTTLSGPWTWPTSTLRKRHGRTSSWTVGLWLHRQIVIGAPIPN